GAAVCGSRGLWGDAGGALSQFDALSQPARDGEAAVPCVRSLRDLSADRRHIHAVHAGDAARAVGLDAVRDDLVAGAARRRERHVLPQPVPRTLGGVVSGDGMAGRPGVRAAATRAAGPGYPVADRRRDHLYGRGAVLRALEARGALARGLASLRP